MNGAIRQLDPANTVRLRQESQLHLTNWLTCSLEARPRQTMHREY